MPAPVSKSPVVLVVEDDRLIRILLCELIEAAGFTPLDACDAGEALHLLEERSDIELVFTDVVMPGRIDGLELARLVGRRWPNVRLVVASGEVLIAKDHLPAGTKVFHKPYGAAAVVSALKDMLEPDGAPGEAR